MINMLFTERKIASGQFNKLRFSFSHRGYFCEVILQPEGDEWVKQRQPVMRWYNGRRWIDVMVPPMESLVGPYPSTYGPREDARNAALDMATQELITYLSGWIDIVIGIEVVE